MSEDPCQNEQLLLALGEAIRATAQFFQEALLIMTDDALQAVAATPCSASPMQPDAKNPRGRRAQ
jgi:hypothetical protein